MKRNKKFINNCHAEPSSASQRFFGCKFLSFRGRSPWNLKNLHPLNDEINHDCHCEECNDEAIQRIFGRTERSESGKRGRSECLQSNTNDKPEHKENPRHYENPTSGLPRSRWSLAMTTGKTAFTLAEVLITLTIIGVIAALTIPNLMQKWSDQHTISGVKEAYAILDNAFKLAIRENGAMVTEWDWPNTNWYQYKVNGNYLAEQLMPFLKVKTYCGSVVNGSDEIVEHCFSFKGSKNYGAWKYYKALNGSNLIIINDPERDFGGRMMLQNGMTIAFRVIYPKTIGTNYGNAGATWGKDYIGSVLVDINGQKGPNQFGIDVFYLPFGPNGMLVCPNAIVANNTNIADHQKGNCSNKSSNGISCGVWILLHKNVDYKYRDVSAEW